MIKVIFIPNSFDPKKDRQIKEFEYKGKILADYIPKLEGLSVYLNQQKTKDFDTLVPDGSEILIVCKPRISALATTFMSWMSAAFVTGTISGYIAVGLSYIAAGAVVIAGSRLLSSMMTPQTPNNAVQGIEQSQTYSWSQAVTRPNAGSPIPILYGTMQLPGNIIQRKIEYVGDDEYLYLQLALCMGEVEDISINDVYINDNPLANYEDVEFMFRNGTNVQSVMPYFSEVETPTDFTTEFSSTSPIIKQINGDTAQAIRIFLQFPNGIYYQNDKGGLDGRSVEFKVEYKNVNDTVWTTAQMQDKRVAYWEYEYERYWEWSGSCFAAGQKVLMADNTYKNIEDVKVGEKVKGAYGFINTVEYLQKPLRNDRIIWDADGLLMTSEHGILNAQKDGFLYISMETGASEYGTEEDAFDKDGNVVKVKFDGLSDTKRGQLRVGSNVASEFGSRKIMKINATDREDEYVYHLLTDGDRTYCIENTFVSSFASDNRFDYKRGVLL